MSTHFINTLSENSQTVYAIGALLIHRTTGEEKSIDMLVEDNGFAAVHERIRALYPRKDWEIHEAWDIDVDATQVKPWSIEDAFEAIAA